MSAETTTLKTPRWPHAGDRFEHATMAVAGLVLLRVLLEHGYRLDLPGAWHRGLSLSEPVLLVLFLITASVRTAVRWREMGRSSVRHSAFDVATLVITLVGLPGLYPALVLVLLRQAGLAVRWIFSTSWAQDWLRALQTTPERLLLLSFGFLILVGTYLLSLPAAVAGDTSAAWHEALFTAASAVCVTGLVVVDTGTYFSLFGQWIILALIQAGGLGIMTLSTAAALFLGRRLGFGQRKALQSLLGQDSAQLLKRTIRFIVFMTFSIEAVGFLFLWIYWWIEGGGMARSAYLAIFHAVSAFCNAGFSLFTDNLMGFRDSFWVQLCIGTLIIAGGLGFMVIADLGRREVWRSICAGHWPALSLHSRLVLISSTVLLLVGTLVIFFLEFDNTLAGMPLREKALASAFQSLTLRTAGFNTIEIAAVKPATLVVMILWMWVGAAPGSTGGGVKISTVVVLILLFRSLLRGRPQVEVFGRTIGAETVNKAIAVALVSGIIVAVFLSLFLWMEPDLGFDRVLFESVSAFGTVGLSTGVTPQLGLTARVLMIFLMLAGRLGPLTLALAVGRSRSVVPVHYPEGKVIVG
ncbi:MAG: TrkH family potassium uptake protein [Acidobacteria bacterium]|nr:TrkH family potassium uptake protein [Acidobacteriota bacterium]